MPRFHCFNAPISMPMNAILSSFSGLIPFHGLVPDIVLTWALSLLSVLGLPAVPSPTTRHHHPFDAVSYPGLSELPPPNTNLHLEDHVELFPVCGESIGLCLPPPAILLPTY